MKKAMLVTLSITTRVVVEADPKKGVGSLEEKAINAAIEKINKNPKEYIIEDNVENICYDDKCPYGSMPNDEKECF